MTQARDFTRPRSRITFTVDDDTFEATPVLAAGTLLDFVRVFETTSATSADQLAAFLGALKMALTPDSYARFSERIHSHTEPIDLDQVTDILLWLLEMYGARPTRPSSSSADGPSSPESGTSSTATTSEPAPISSLSPLTAS